MNLCAAAVPREAERYLLFPGMLSTSGPPCSLLISICRPLFFPFVQFSMRKQHGFQPLPAQPECSPQAPPLPDTTHSSTPDSCFSQRQARHTTGSPRTVLLSGITVVSVCVSINVCTKLRVMFSQCAPTMKQNTTSLPPLERELLKAQLALSTGSRVL